jgi:hypothetical protein
VMSALAIGTRFLASALCTTIAPLSHNGLRWEKYNAKAIRMVNSAASQSTIFFFFVIPTPIAIFYDVYSILPQPVRAILQRLYI